MIGVISNTIAESIVNIQPMSGPVGEIFCMKVYKPEFKSEEERIRYVNNQAYRQVKADAEFMLMDTSTWKDPDLTKGDK